MNSDKKYELLVFCARSIKEVVFACVTNRHLNAEHNVLMFYQDGAGNSFESKRVVEEIVAMYSWDNIVFVSGLSTCESDYKRAGFLKGLKYDVKSQIYNRCVVRSLFESAMSLSVGKQRGQVAVFFTSPYHVLDQNIMGILPRADRCLFSSDANALDEYPEVFEPRGRLARRVACRSMTPGVLMKAIFIKFVFRMLGEGKYYIPFDGTDSVYVMSGDDISAPILNISRDALQKAVSEILSSIAMLKENEDSIRNILSSN